MDLWKFAPESWEPLQRGVRSQWPEAMRQPQLWRELKDQVDRDIVAEIAVELVHGDPMLHDGTGLLLERLRERAAAAPLEGARRLLKIDRVISQDLSAGSDLFRRLRAYGNLTKFLREQRKLINETLVRLGVEPVNGSGEQAR